MIVKTPDRTYQIGEKGLPPLGQPVVSWPWGNTPSLSRWSLDALKYPLGTIVQDTIDGHPVIAQIQTHDTYGVHPEWGIRPHKGTSVYVPTVMDGASGKQVAMKDPPDGWGVSPMAGWFYERRTTPELLARLHEGDHMHWREHYTKVPKLGVLLGTTVAGFLVGGPIGAAVGFAGGLVIDKEVRGGSLLPSFSGEGSWKVKRYDPTTGAFYYVGAVNAGSEGAAMDAACSQLFSASAAKPYTLPGFTNVYITNAGDVFRLGMES